MKKTFTRLLVMALALAVLMTSMIIPAMADSETRTIKILHKGPKPEGWDAVYEQYLALTKDNINVALDINWVEHPDYKDKMNLEVTSGGDWDLVFDASWIHLKELAAEGYYADLSQYFNNPEQYPGLAKAFSADVMEANTWFGKMCYIPLFETYGNGLGCIWYRKDWAEQWGIEINSDEDLAAYWQAAIDNGYIGYTCTSARGFFQLGTIAGSYLPGSAKAGLQQWSAGGLTVWFYIKDGAIAAYAVEGQGDEAFANFPEGWQYDFGMDRFEKFEAYQQAGYIDADSMSSSDASTPFYSGLSASFIGTLDDVEAVQGSCNTYGLDFDTQIGYYLYDEAVRNMEDASIPSNRAGNNGWSVPVTSKNVEATMDFLNWMFGSQENHDLIQLGIEGKDFEYGENRTYKPLTDYTGKLGGYGFSWNPTYALLSQAYTGKLLEYRTWEYSEAPFFSTPVLGFNFNTADIDLSTAIAQCKAVTDMVSIVKLHGIAIDGNGNAYPSLKEMIQSNTQEALANGGSVVVEAMVQQLSDFLANK